METEFDYYYLYFDSFKDTYILIGFDRHDMDEDWEQAGAWNVDSTVILCNDNLNKPGDKLELMLPEDDFINDNKELIDAVFKF